MAQLRRILKHLLSTRRQLRRAFPHQSLDSIEQEIQASEVLHSGEIRFVVESALAGPSLYLGQTPRERAIDLFSQLRMWDTEHRNGVLIYLLLADHAVEIVADRGVNSIAGPQQWQGICRNMESAFRAGHYRQGALDGIRALNQLLIRHFPVHNRNRNELPNKVLVL